MSQAKNELINATSRAEIDLWLAKFPSDQKQSAVMTALRMVQEQNGGWLTTELMDAVADYLDMDKIHVYEVATFYSMFEHKPVGKHKVCVCTNISCMICGSGEIVEHLEDKLNIKLGETTADNLITLKEVECLGACSGAPMLQIGEDYYENLDIEKIDKILDGLK
ncbi:NADH-quinone oxidoreductase subunit NuoE [sulfur-oxidizing endosymbiont of Gigantopelta aegis]|uniref:NADH-quinone oxidoreductase subunit NuoE n=1 Tax=sulfur-oxidizing endosymbiont of Gigantopelta aegis TaxID=2794934 RepID=UPI0018DDF8FE|nr:NADH-quinone oxidoreductase subunit NuoE [sulfur-oxidizing endosymbiont of Gigantopelta aegis]